MEKIGLFYGSDWGHTERVAKVIQAEFAKNVIDVYNVAQNGPDDMARYKYLIFGVPTAEGHGLQKDWENIYDGLEKINFKNKRVALFGLGDQKTFPLNFCDGLGLLYQKITNLGAETVGRWPLKGYSYEESYAEENGSFVGLVLDIENQPEKTTQRISKWVRVIKKKMNQ